MERYKLAIGMGALMVGLALPSYAVDREEGGYAGTTDEGHGTVVYNFLKHFNYEQYYYSYKHQWTWNNDNRVDAMDFAIFAGHGNKWYISGLDGGVDLATAGSTSDKGYGSLDAEFVAFESCYVVTSPIETADWYSKWTAHSNGVFDGLHQALGFHTVSWQSTDQKVTDYFGARIAAGYGVWESWFAAINAKGLSTEKGSAVMHPSADGDTYANFVSDPTQNHTSLRIWYQY
tara:strand:+ start:324 stop:1019 length:696 start_codon:yes stop_codon:yes gene_type:complete